ncbi:hypothetical protein PG996_002657 [Apiospora saccharicola]|uniref:Uncharacterized protein n=1 Tax=Apiospora saccharicola TaxID=335842 RepID=A0ABR1WK27_9PEZI
MPLKIEKWRTEHARAISLEEIVDIKKTLKPEDGPCWHCLCLSGHSDAFGYFILCMAAIGYEGNGLDTVESFEHLELLPIMTP